MAHPGIPGKGSDGTMELTCGETIEIDELHLMMREYECACGESHAVVMDPHPLSRFFPEEIVSVLQQTIATSPEDEFDEFGIVHLMGVVMDDYPEEIAVHDAAEDGTVGYAMVWVTEFDSRRLHEIAVELMLELMEHAVSHAEDESAMSDFEAELMDFDIDEFVTQYREQRDFEDEFDEAV